MPLPSLRNDCISDGNISDDCVTNCDDCDNRVVRPFQQQTASMVAWHRRHIRDLHVSDSRPLTNAPGDDRIGDDCIGDDCIGDGHMSDD